MKKIMLVLILIFSACGKNDVDEDVIEEMDKKDDCAVGEICWYPNEKVEVAEKLEDINDLNGFYSKGKKYIYYGGKKMNNRIESADYKTFEVLGGLDDYGVYAKDKNNVYFRGQIILKDDGVDLDTFEVLDGFFGYAKDKNNIFIDRAKYENIDVDTFKIIHGGYAKDKNNVYYCGNIVEGVTPNNFELVSRPLRKFKLPTQSYKSLQLS